MIDRQAARLLRRHERRRADDRPGVRERRVGLFLAVHDPRQAEVEDLHAPARPLQPDIARLDVAMNQPALVGCGEPFGDLTAEAQRLGRGQGALATEVLGQRLALEQRHGQEGDAVVFIDLVDGDDVVVFNGSLGLGFAEEALARGRVGGVLRQNYLQGDLPFEPGILGLENHAHAALAEYSQHPVGPQSAELVRLLRWSQETGAVIDFRGPGRPRIGLAMVRRLLGRAGPGRRIARPGRH